MMDRHLLARASRMFNSVADLRDEGDQRINEWFKEQLRAAERCVVCDRARDSELHYIGTVDSHEFVAPPAALGHAGSDTSDTARRRTMAALSAESADLPPQDPRG